MVKERIRKEERDRGEKTPTIPSEQGGKTPLKQEETCGRRFGCEGEKRKEKG